MRRALQDEQDLFEERDFEEPRDVVLGTSALLGIFLAVALVCAVCFGFGYSEGHGIRGIAGAAPTGKQKPAPMPLGGSDASEEAVRAPEQPALESRIPDEPAPKPAPGIAAEAPAGEVPAMPPETASDTGPIQTEPARPAPAAEPTRGALVSVPDTSASPALAAPPTPLRLMVQIAAVSRAADAQTLASALQHDGFAATVRTSPADTLFHVQIGPFPSFTAAKEMRARLAGNGYNAFIKP